MKIAIILLTDPKSGTEEALTRMLNGLGVADEAKRRGDELVVAFAGTGTRWPAELAKPLHPAHGRFNFIRDKVIGASRSCAARNGAVEGLAEAGVPLVGDNEIPGTQGVLSYRRLIEDGFTVLMF